MTRIFLIEYSWARSIFIHSNSLWLDPLIKVVLKFPSKARYAHERFLQAENNFIVDEFFKGTRKTDRKHFKAGGSVSKGLKSA